MALTDESGMGTTMLVGPTGYGNNGGFGDFGGGWMWLIVLFVLMGGWGNGGFGGNGGNIYPWMNQANQISDGFANQANGIAISGVQNAITSGFGDVQTALCGGFAGVNATVNGAQNAIAQQLYANQIAGLERSFAAQTANTAGMTGLQSQLAQCCCDNRLATANLTAVVQQENCADRAALSDGIRDVLVAQNAGIQRILDTMCQDKIDEKNEKIAELQNRLNMASFNASQLEQNNYLQNALTAQTQYFLGLYPPTAPAARTATATA